MLDKTIITLTTLPEVLETPSGYDEVEQYAMLSLPNRVIEASRAVAFQKVGYPTHVNDVRELWRYADVMQESRLKPTFDAIGGLTQDEFELVRRVTRDVIKLTRDLCGHRVLPGAALIRAVPVYREIKKRFPRSQDCSIFELGAGSGYVGALLQADRYFYQTSDIAQAFALWQMHLLGREAVIPWWEWMTGGADVMIANVFTANHMLNEMHPHALAYTAKAAKKMLGDHGIFLVENYGCDHVVRTDAQTIAILEKHGIKPTRVMDGLDTPNRTVQWPHMVEWWHSECGGIPKSDDERFLESLA
jgi:hypothetical protein